MPEKSVESLSVVMHTAHPELYGSRPGMSVKLGCSLLVLFLVLGAATFVLMWAAIAVIMLLMTTRNDQELLAMKNMLLNGNTITVVGIVVCMVIGSAIALPVAAFSEAEDFLLWLKQR